MNLFLTILLLKLLNLFNIQNPVLTLVVKNMDEHEYDLYWNIIADELNNMSRKPVSFEPIEDKYNLLVEEVRANERVQNFWLQHWLDQQKNLQNAKFN